MTEGALPERKTWMKVGRFVLMGADVNKVIIAGAGEVMAALDKRSKSIWLKSQFFCFAAALSMMFLENWRTSPCEWLSVLIALESIRGERLARIILLWACKSPRGHREAILA